jgi:tetratricopeptide (TPR) repeat protein
MSRSDAVSRIEQPRTADGPLPPLGCPRRQAEQMLSTALQAKDRRLQAAAMNDLGVICVSEGQASRAVALLEESLAIAEQIGDPALQIDVRGNLGFALLHVQQPKRALEVLEQALSQARTRVDGYAEKRVLERLGRACGWLGMHSQALGLLEQALAISQAIGDEAHQADLLWLLAIQHAELGQRDQALARGEATLLLLGHRKHPHLSWFADNLRKYATSNVGLSTPAASSQIGMENVAIVSAWRSQSNRAPGPRLLHMAFEAAKSLADFLMAGLKTVPADVQRQRLQTCATCAHHSGLRCRICGCFTNIKTRMSHEDCPLGKWPQFSK